MVKITVKDLSNNLLQMANFADQAAADSFVAILNAGQSSWGAPQSFSIVQSDATAEQAALVAKQASIQTIEANLYSGGVVGPQSSGSQNGYLSSTDWTNFNKKVGSLLFTPSTPARTLNTVFTPSATNAVMVFYTVSISCSMTLTSGQTGAVELRSDTNPTPTTVRARVSNTNSGTLTIGLALVNAQEAELSYLVPAGHNIKLVSSGTATIAITSQSEVLISGI